MATCLSLQDARRVIAAAEKRAAEIGRPMNIAVADEGGNLVSHIRMDGAWIGSVDRKGVAASPILSRSVGALV